MTSGPERRRGGRGVPRATGTVVAPEAGRIYLCFVKYRCLRPGTGRPLRDLPAWLLLAAGALGAVGCGEDAEPPEVARLVTVAPVVADEATESLTLLGEVQGEKEVRLAAEVPEKVVEIHVAEGDQVDKGDALVTLDAGLLAADLAQAQAAEEVARANRDELRSELERIRGLVGQGAAAMAQLESLETRLRAAEAQVAQLAAAQRAAGRRRARSTLRAPFDGTVASIAVEEGDLAAPQMPVALLVQMARVEVALQVAERDFLRIDVGDEARVRPPAKPALVRVGQVARRSPVVDRVTRTGTVVVAVDNEDEALLPGMVAEVDLVLARRTGVVMVPAEAVVMTPETARTDRAEVFLVDEAGRRAERRTITLGRRYGGRLEIADGLAPGERVVVRGQHLLRDGALIRLTEDQIAAAGQAPAVDADPAAAAAAADDDAADDDDDDPAAAARPQGAGASAAAAEDAPAPPAVQGNAS